MIKVSKYINLDKINDILNNDEREAFSKNQIYNFLNSHDELVISVSDFESSDIETGEYKIIKNNLRYVLKEAGRYDDICNILNDIISDDSFDSYTVDPYINDQGDTKRRVTRESLRSEGSEFLKLINGDGYEYMNTPIFNNSFSNLCSYVKTKTNMLLHNYSVSISHGIDPMDIEKIKPWQVLDYIIMQLRIDKLRLDNDTFYIPDGWRKK